MRSIFSLLRGPASVLALLTIAGCADELPTLDGTDRFRGGTPPTTVEVLVPTSQFLAGDTVHGDFTNPRDAGFLLAAHRFDGVLEAHSLARFTGFPDSVTFTLNGASRTEADFAFAGGRVVATVNPEQSFSPGSAVLQLWALEQEWDSATVSWTVAQGSGASATRWRVPGGTRGTLLSQASWTPGDTVARDTVRWEVDSLAVRRMAAPGFAGLLVTSATANSRVQLGRLTLQTAQRPTSRPDTTVSVTLTQGPQELIFDPAPPRPAGVFRVGGLTGDRTVLRLSLPRTVPACANPATTPSCPQIPLKDVTLNRATLVLDALPVHSGFRPVGPAPLLVRRLLEPELGRRASLAEGLTFDTIPASRFQGSGSVPVTLNLTRSLGDVLAADSTALSVALLSDPEGQQFGYLWFARTPRLRLLYTLPVRPGLP